MWLKKISAVNPGNKIPTVMCVNKAEHKRFDQAHKNNNVTMA